MESELIIAVIVLVVVAAHVGLYRWVKFKIHEGVILKFLREAEEGATPGYHKAEAIAAKTDISARRVGVVCRKSVEIRSDPEAGNSWRAQRV